MTLIRRGMKQIAFWYVAMAYMRQEPIKGPSAFLVEPEELQQLGRP